MGRPMLSKSLIQFFVDGWSCVPSLSFTWDQTMVEIMQIMVTSFKRSHACTATLSAPSPAAGDHRPTPLLETSGHSRASLGQSLVGSLLLFSGPWYAQGSVCAIQESVSQSCISSGGSKVGLMVTSSKRGLTLLHKTSVQFSRSVMSNSLRPHESQHTRPPCPSSTPGVHSDSRPLSQ